MPDSEAHNHKAVKLLSRLASADSEEAWPEFLSEYSGLILQVIRVFEKDPDSISDCFLFVCEQISRARFARLRKFDSRKANFSTWLRVVVRNLLFDWHRQEFGRHRVFESIAAMPLVDQEVFECVFVRKFSEAQTASLLEARFAGLDETRISDIVERISSNLTPRQRWLLANRHPVFQPTSEDCGEKDAVQLRQLNPNPEELAVAGDLQEKLRKGLQRLPPSQRTLIRLRYEEQLSLAACAKFTGLENAQKVDRQIRTILGRLKSLMEV